MPNNKSRKMMRKSRGSSTRVSTKDGAAGKQLSRMVSRTSGPSQLLRAVFPVRLHRTLRYADCVAMTSTSGSVALQQWAVNSLFDPDFTNTGHQPRGFDQLCSATGPYIKYRVLRSRVKITIIPDSNFSVVGAAGFSDLSTIPTNPGGSVVNNCTGNSELPGWKALAVGVHTVPMVFSFESPISVIESVQESAVLSEDNYSANYNASPADVAYFSVQIMQIDGSTATTQCLIELEFDAQFEEPILLAAS